VSRRFEVVWSFGNAGERGVEGNRNTGSVTPIWVNPMKEPAREHDEQSGLRPDPERLAIWIAGRSYSVYACSRIEKL
jgi:hypothetical protein